MILAFSESFLKKGRIFLHLHCSAFTTHISHANHPEDMLTLDQRRENVVYSSTLEYFYARFGHLSLSLPREILETCDKYRKEVIHATRDPCVLAVLLARIVLPTLSKYTYRVYLCALIHICIVASLKR